MPQVIVNQQVVGLDEHELPSVVRQTPLVDGREIAPYGIVGLAEQDIGDFRVAVERLELRGIGDGLYSRDRRPRGACYGRPPA